MTDKKPLPSMIGIETLVGGVMVIIGIWGLVATFDTMGTPLMMVVTILGLITAMEPVGRHYDAKKIAEREAVKKAQEEKLWEMYWQ